MSPFTVLALCIQACLIQSVMCNCGYGDSYRTVSYNSAPCISYSSSPSVSYISAPKVAVSSVNLGSNAYNSYGGQGEGVVSAAGDIGISGQTLVNGAVPVEGKVSFGGYTQASGSTSITGQCGCGCAF